MERKEACFTISCIVLACFLSSALIQGNVGQKTENANIKLSSSSNRVTNPNLTLKCSGLQNSYQQSWNRTWGVGTDGSLAATTDAAGNVYVTGYTQSSTYLRKYDNTGALLWAQTINQPYSVTNLINSISVDSSGVYVCGTFFGKVLSRPFLVKYSTSGSLLWSRVNMTGTTSNASGRAVVSSSGNGVVLAGSTWLDFNATLFLSTLYIMRYDPNGNLVWNNTWRDGYSSGVYAMTSALPAMDGIYLTGAKFAPSFSGFVSKYNWEGLSLWNVTTGTELGLSISHDNASNAIINGIIFSSPIATSYSTYLAKYNPSGALLMNQTTNLITIMLMGTEYLIYPTSISINQATGNIFCVDNQKKGTSSSAIFFGVYNPSGALFSSITIGNGYINNTGTGVAIDQSTGAIYLVGTMSMNGMGLGTYFLAKLIPIPTITVTAPSTSDSWVAGSSKDITWTSSGSISNMDIYLSNSSGSTVIVSGVTNNGSYSWTIPSSQAAGNYQIVIYQTGNHAINGTSSTFSITAPSTPTSPTIPGYMEVFLIPLVLLTTIGIIWLLKKKVPLS